PSFPTTFEKPFNTSTPLPAIISAGALGVGKPADTSGQKTTSSRFDRSQCRSGSGIDKQLALYRT
ncbi:hypothetical protein, partial [Vibrio parahaemolyticus]|uniref:hypothetical protein n=1 Tax=Vibrio parahaemolyticus TaxID=670 RepID=UPI001C5F5116